MNKFNIKNNVKNFFIFLSFVQCELSLSYRFYIVYSVLLKMFFFYIVLKGPHCFNYTWPASSIDDKNCTKHNIRNPYTPCTTPYDSR